MTKSFSSVLLLPLLLTLTLQCGNLCLYCYTSTYDYYCSTCVSNAEYYTYSTCTCSSGYYQSGQSCLALYTFPVWGYILIAFAVFVVVIIIVTYCRKRQNSNNTGYNTLAGPVGYMATDAATGPMNTDARINVSPANPIGRQEGASPYSPQFNQYVPPPTNAVAYPNEEICGACMRGGCDCRTSCGHASHKNCLDAWKMPNCPTCKRNIPELNRF